MERRPELIRAFLRVGAKMSLQTINLPDDKTVNLNKVYDAVIIGSGAAGGMAAHVLTSHGMKVLLLEAGRKINTTEELKSTEWPYEHPRRGDMPPGSHALSFNEYTIRQPPYSNGVKANHVYSYVQVSTQVFRRYFWRLCRLICGRFSTSRS